MKAKSYAKINLSLDVVGKREDGYHNIKTIMQKISLYDEIEFRKIDRGFNLKSNVSSINNDDNLIYKAWKCMCEYKNRELPIEVTLKKNIPIAAGLAGGSGNGAETLKAINKLYNIGLSIEELREMSLKIGADFPYMLTGGTVLASGIGEKLERLTDFNGVSVLIVNPNYGIFTKSVYQNISIEDNRIDFDKIVESMKYKSAKKLKGLLENKMEKVVFKNHPDIALIKCELENFGATSLMSGSGSTVFGLFDDDIALNKAYLYFFEKYKNCYKAVTVGGEDEI
ncbi:4-(cytidine 5'-diphospho)-2-C-methyl-D-erythritol kinase [Peptoniphilus sp. oral taxon 386]|uniref:4-(cytidine 5'-diphospho)-2-C-methyl-D-erythritol kinase n=1 Tax=Peptoniphilus sp. oral taxon 386 TaxID=652713 RepID=UPI0001DA9ED0|nr:4-(cytidine 5'-diphospho)-2-C-methyl-D-erythritol kinase [Peptoniphilus sp. oral taxon 386]EFI41510.1 4-(cytidine 5'-diphospho)-2-C-methyl-D-erythritol kinase [Peptoniphilus sp. oral taxon 386 str. F0131]